MRAVVIAIDMIGTTHVCNVKSLSLPQVRLGLQIIAVRAARNSLLGPQFIAVRAARESDPSPQVTSSRARCSARGGGGGTRVARHEQLKCIVLRAFSAGHSRGRTQRAAARPARKRGVEFLGKCRVLFAISAGPSWRRRQCEATSCAASVASRTFVVDLIDGHVKSTSRLC